MKIVISITRHNVTRVLAVILLLLAIRAICVVPYYQYGRETSVFLPTDGMEDALLGSWTKQDVDAGAEGYEQIDITGAKKMTVTSIRNGETITEAGKVNYKEKTGVLKLTFGDGRVVETTFLPQISFDSVKHASLLGYAALSYEHEELTDELKVAMEKEGDTFSYRDLAVPTVILPLFLVLALVLGLVLRKKPFALSFMLLPALYGVYLMYIQKIACRGLTQGKTHILVYLILLALLAVFDYLSETGKLTFKKNTRNIQA